MADKKPPLTDEQIRAMFTQLIQDQMHYGADARSLEIALLRKGLLTESEIVEAKKEVSREMKEQIDKIAAATQTKPPEGIQ